MNLILKIFVFSLTFLWVCNCTYAVTNVSSCMSLSDDYGVYEMNESITDGSSSPCIFITGDHIVFDCKGHTIDGDSAALYGMAIVNKVNVTVKNCIVKQWNQANMYIQNTNSSNITDSTFTETTHVEAIAGLYTQFSYLNSITNCSFSDNTYDGLWLFDSSNNTVTNCTMSNNKHWGITLDKDSDFNNISYSRITNNTQSGIYFNSFTEQPDNCYIYNNLFNNTVNYNDDYSPNSLFFNVTKQSGTRIHSDGNYIGGNFWTNSTSNGFSDTCTDSNRDGFCDSTYTVTTGVIDYQPYSDIDLTEPVITVDSPESKTYGTSTVWFNTSINENSSWCGFSLDSADNVTMTNDSMTHFYFENTTMTNMLHSVVFYCNDTVDNMGHTSSLSFTVDTTTLLITIDGPTNDTYATDNIWFNTSMNKNTDWCVYNLDDSVANVSMQNDSQTHYYKLNSSMSDGSHNVKFWCNDSALGTIVNSLTLHFTIDTTKPTIDIISPINDTYYTSSVYYNVSINENTDWCAYSLNSADNISMTKKNDTYFYYHNTSMIQDYYTIVFSCNDSVGNMNHSNTLGFSVGDITAPQVTITHPENTTVYDFYDIFECSFDEIVNWAAYSIDDAANVTIGAVQTFKKSLQDLGLTYGSHKIIVYANDSYNNMNITTRFWTKTEYTTGSVVTETVPVGYGSLSGVSMALDSNGFAHVSYMLSANLKYCNNTQGWMNCTTAYYTGVFCDTTSIAIDSNDKVHIVFGHDSDNGLEYCNNTNGSWTCVMINTEMAEDPSIAIDSNDKVHVSYRSNTHNTLKYCNNLGGPWACEIADSFPYYTGVYSSITLDSNNIPYISHAVLVSSQLRLCDKSSGSWSCQQLVDGYNSYYSTSSIAIDKNNVKHIAFSDTTKITYCTNVSTSYECVTVEDPTSEAIGVSISIDKRNSPHIIYRKDTYLNGMVRHCDNRYNSSEWVCTDIVSTGYTNPNHPEYNTDRRLSFFKGRLTDIFTASDSDFSNDAHFVESSATTINYTRIVGYGLDARPPIITINNPLNDTVSSDVLNITFDETVNWSAYCIDDCVSNTTIGSVDSYATNMTGLYDDYHNITVYANDSDNSMRTTTRYWTRLTSITVLPTSRTKALIEEGTDLFNITTEHDSSVIRNMTYACLSGDLCNPSKFTVTFEHNSVNVTPTKTSYNEVNVTAKSGLATASYVGVIQVKQVYDNKTENISITYNVLAHASDVDITPLIISAIDMTNAQTIVRTIYYNNTGDWNATHCNFSASALSSFIGFSKDDFTIEVADYNTSTITVTRPTTGSFASIEITLTCFAYTGSDVDSDTSYIDINVATAAEDEGGGGGGGAAKVSDSVCGNGICEWDETADINDTDRTYCPQDCLAIEGNLTLKFDIAPKFYVLFTTAGSKKTSNFKLENYNAHDYVMCLTVMCTENDTSCMWADLDADGEIKKNICVNVPGGNRDEPGVKLVNFITTIPKETAAGAFRYNILIENSTIGYRAIFPVSIDMRFGLLTRIWMYVSNVLSRFGESWGYIIIPFKQGIFGLNEITLGHVYILFILVALVFVIWRIMRYSKRYKSGRKSFGGEFLQ